MLTRYRRLRSAIVNLAADPDAQIAWLDETFSGITGGRSAEDYGNVELAEELDDIFPAIDHMLEHGELSQAEIDAVVPLSALLDRVCPRSPGDPFWQRPALSSDRRWQEIRQLAKMVLKDLPDEERDSDCQRAWRSDEP